MSEPAWQSVSHFLLGEGSSQATSNNVRTNYAIGQQTMGTDSSKSEMSLSHWMHRTPGPSHGRVEPNEGSYEEFTRLRQARKMGNANLNLLKEQTLVQKEKDTRVKELLLFQTQILTWVRDHEQKWNIVMTGVRKFDIKTLHHGTQDKASISCLADKIHSHSHLRVDTEHGIHSVVKETYPSPYLREMVDTTTRLLQTLSSQGMEVTKISSSGRLHSCHLRLVTNSKQGYGLQWRTPRLHRPRTLYLRHCHLYVDPHVYNTVYASNNNNKPSDNDTTNADSNNSTESPHVSRTYISSRCPVCDDQSCVLCHTQPRLLSKQCYPTNWSFSLVPPTVEYRSSNNSNDSPEAKYSPSGANQEQMGRMSRAELLRASAKTKTLDVDCGSLDKLRQWICIIDQNVRYIN